MRKCGGLFKKVWRGDGWPKEERTGLVIPLIKKGEGKKVEEVEMKGIRRALERG